MSNFDKSSLSEAAAEKFDMEFRSDADDAWYTVRLLRDGERLTVKYLNFDDGHDNVFEADRFKSVKELEDFKSRFRPVSVQLQDHECSKVVEGMLVCASHSFTDDDNLFYDAIVEEVKYGQHSFRKGEEECRCFFLLFWQHGPDIGNLMAKNVESICVVQHTTEIVPELASFVEIAMKKIESASHKSGLISNAIVPVCSGGSLSSDYARNCSPVVKLKNKSRPSHRLTKGTRCAKQSVSKVWSSEGREIGNLCASVREDSDFGGLGNQCIILIDNLEKELSPLAVMEFIHKQTSISSQACVFPTSSSESYTRGAILLDCEKDFEKLYEFLDNPNHIITSLKGRPWVVTKKLFGHNTLRVSIGTLIFLSQKNLLSRSNEISNELKIVLSGTKEYGTARELRDLFKEFASHQEGLHKRLAMEEKRILQQS